MDEQLFEAAGEESFSSGKNIEYLNDDDVSQVIFYLSTRWLYIMMATDDSYDDDYIYKLLTWSALYIFTIFVYIMTSITFTIFVYIMNIQW